jgi:uncharacterized membrane protein
MKQEVRNFLRNLSNCWGIVQRNSSKLGNELVNIFRNASIGMTVTRGIVSPLCRGGGGGGGGRGGGGGGGGGGAYTVVSID